MNDPDRMVIELGVFATEYERDFAVNLGRLFCDGADAELIGGRVPHRDRQPAIFAKVAAALEAAGLEMVEVSLADAPRSGEDDAALPFSM